MRVFELFGELALRDENFRAALQKDAAAMRSMGGGVQKFGKSISAVGDKMSRAGTIATVGMTLPIVAGFKKAIDEASHLNEAMDFTTQVFGGAAKGMRKFAEGAIDSMGLATATALDAANTFGVQLTNSMGLSQEAAAEMSKQLIKLAVDMASAKDVPLEEALLAIASGLAGESEPLRRFGIDLRVARLESDALSDGLIKQGQALEGTRKEQQIMNSILSQGSIFNDNYADTADSAANRQRKLAEQAKNTAASFGEQLLPIAEDLLGELTRLLKMFASLPKPMQGTIIKTLALAAAVGPLLKVTGLLFKGIGGGISLFIKLRAAIIGTTAATTAATAATTSAAAATTAATTATAGAAAAATGAGAATAGAAAATGGFSFALGRLAGGAARAIGGRALGLVGLALAATALGEKAGRALRDATGLGEAIDRLRGRSDEASGSIDRTARSLGSAASASSKARDAHSSLAQQFSVQRGGWNSLREVVERARQSFGGADESVRQVNQRFFAFSMGAGALKRQAQAMGRSVAEAATAFSPRMTGAMNRMQSSMLTTEQRERRLQRETDELRRRIERLVEKPRILRLRADTSNILSGIAKAHSAIRTLPREVVVRLRADTSNIVPARARRLQHGGRLSPGELGLVGEVGPELIEGPARIRPIRRAAPEALASQLSAGNRLTRVQNISITLGDVWGVTDLDDRIRRAVARATR